MPRTDTRSRFGLPDETSRISAGGDESDGGAVENLAVGVPMSQIVPRTLSAFPSVVMIDQPHSVAAERFRRLKTKILNEYKDSAQVIVVTSAAPREGKSVVALNLALTFAADRGLTLLIDADLRRPTVHALMRPEPGLGLSEVLLGAAKVDHAVYRLKNSLLQILPAGKPVSNPAELFSSDRCKSLIASMREGFQRIIIDTPPIVPFTDADALGSCADGALVVARAGSTRKTSFADALSLLTSTRILGAILNDVTFSLADYGHYDDYYRSYYEESRPK